VQARHLRGDVRACRGQRVSAAFDLGSEASAAQAAGETGNAGTHPSRAELRALVQQRWNEVLTAPQLPDVDQAQASLAVEVVLDALAAREPQAAPAGCRCGHPQADHAFSGDVCAVPVCPCPRYVPNVAQPAPELAAVEAVRVAVAEEWQPRVDALRELLAEILDEFGRTSNGYSAHVGQAPLARWRERVRWLEENPHEDDGYVAATLDEAVRQVLALIPEAK
jgi:hypothetical protein